MKANELERSDLTISKTGIVSFEDTSERDRDQSIVDVTRANRLVYYHGYLYRGGFR